MQGLKEKVHWRVNNSWANLNEFWEKNIFTTRLTIKCLFCIVAIYFFSYRVLEMKGKSARLLLSINGLRVIRYFKKNPIETSFIVLFLKRTKLKGKNHPV